MHCRESASDWVQLNDEYVLASMTIAGVKQEEQSPRELGTSAMNIQGLV